MSNTESGAQEQNTILETQAGTDDQTVSIGLNVALEKAVRAYESGSNVLAEQMADAILEVVPDYPPLRNLKAALLARRGEHIEAQEILDKLIEEFPENEEYRTNMSLIFSLRGEREKAADTMKEMLAEDESDGEKNYRMARLYSGQGKIPEALYYIEKALKADEENADYLCTSSSLKLESGDHAGAELAARKATEQNEESQNAWNALGNALWKQARNTEAVEAFDKSLDLNPGNFNIWGNKGNSFCALGRIAESLESYRKCLSMNPRAYAHWRNYLFAMNYSPDVTADEIFEEHRKYGTLLERSVKIEKRPDCDRDPNRKLRIAYCSSDFKGHSCAYFMLPLIRNHNRDNVEVWCFSEVRKEDRVTQWFKDACDHWVNVVGLSHDHFADKVREAGIDILIDCVGHVGSSRMEAFATRLAPVQATWLGYPNTTGMERMDYRIVDEVSDPEWANRLASETLYRLPAGFLAWNPLDKELPDVAEPPCLKNGYITFGSFNNTSKVHEGVVKIWAEVMHRVPNSRFLLKSRPLADDRTCDLIKEWFAKYGISEDRLNLFAWMPSAITHYALYNFMDIALDPFPYNGTTTTCEALYMGVPTVCWAGDRHSGRVGASLMVHSGFPELVVESLKDYIELAVELTRDLDRLKALRAETREVFDRSPVRDHVNFAARMENAFRDMWHKWLENPDEENLVAEIVKSSPTSKKKVDPWADDPDRMLLKTSLGYRIQVPATLRSLTTNVLLEKETWFEAELPFVYEIVQSGDQVIDIGANYGLFTLASARMTGLWGKVVCFEPSSRTASYLRNSILVNDYDKQTVLRQEAVADKPGTAVLSADAAELKSISMGTISGVGEAVDVTTLNNVITEEGLTNVVFIKIDAEGAEASIIDGGREFFTDQSPLVMLEIKHGAVTETNACFKLVDLGYSIYQLIPALNALVPVSFDADQKIITEELDGFALNMFLCKDDRAAILEERGLLVRENNIPAPAYDVEKALELLRKQPVTTFIPEIVETFFTEEYGPNASEYRDALGHYAEFRDKENSATIRWAHLKKAKVMVGIAATAHPDIPRMITACRIAKDAGQRSKAGQMARNLTNHIYSGIKDININEPFLPTIPRYEGCELTSTEHALNWIASFLMEATELWGSFAGYFSRNINLNYHKDLIELGYASAEVYRRYQLLKIRANKLTRIEGHALITGQQPGHQNGDLWPAGEKPKWLRFD